MDLLAAFGNLLLIIFLGVLVAFNPMLIAVDILLVLRTKRPILNTAILTAGFMSSIVLLFVVAISVIDQDTQISVGKLRGSLEIPPLVDIIAGALLLGLAVKRQVRPQSDALSSNRKGFKIPERPSQLFVFGFAKASLSITNLFAVLILAKMAAINNWDPIVGFMAVTFLLLIGIVPLATVAYYRQFKHKSLASIDKRINTIMSRDTRALITYILAAAGIIFIANGLIGLLRG